MKTKDFILHTYEEAKKRDIAALCFITFMPISLIFCIMGFIATFTGLPGSNLYSALSLFLSMGSVGILMLLDRQKRKQIQREIGSAREELEFLKVITEKRTEFYKILIDKLHAMDMRSPKVGEVLEELNRDVDAHIEEDKKDNLNNPNISLTKSKNKRYKK